MCYFACFKWKLYDTWVCLVLGGWIQQLANSTVQITEWKYPPNLGSRRTGLKNVTSCSSSASIFCLKIA